VSQTPSPVAPSAAPRPAGKPHVHEVRFTSYPKLLFIWPLIVTGLILWPLGNESSTYSPQLEVLGWVYITVLGVVILTLGVDVNRNVAIFWFVLIFALWILGLYLKDVQNVPIFGWIWNWFDAMNVQYSRAMGLAISIILAIPFVLMGVVARINDRWRITHNEFEHYSFGKVDEALGRGAKIIRTEYPDVLEFLLAGAGTLRVISANGNQELRKIQHVMFLPIVRKKLNSILESVSITTEATTGEEEEQSV
jgi:hypothetical protein